MDRLEKLENGALMLSGIYLASGAVILASKNERVQEAALKASMWSILGLGVVALLSLKELR